MQVTVAVIRDDLQMANEIIVTDIEWRIDRQGVFTRIGYMLDDYMRDYT